MSLPGRPDKGEEHRSAQHESIPMTPPGRPEGGAHRSAPREATPGTETMAPPSVQRQVHLAGTGLACALGHGLAASLDTLRRGGVPPTPVTVAEGFAWPVYTLPPLPSPSSTGWLDHARDVIRRVVQESGALDSPRTGPLFIASSSHDVGHREQAEAFGGDVLEFADRIQHWLDWRGPVFAVSTACTSSMNALLSAAACIRNGEADDALVLGIELDNRLTVAGFGAMQLLAPESAQPYGAGRKGLVLGEAVAALRLSSVPSRWRLAGGANVVDGRDPAGTVAGAVEAACRQALAQGGLNAGDIGLLKPQAAGSPNNDVIELEALRQVFDPLPPLVSLKASIGHALGAAGAAEIALLLACIEAGDDACWPRPGYALDESLQVALSPAAPKQLRHLLAAIIGFGGGHTAVVIEDMGEGGAGTGTGTGTG
jgi:3-oxoacyl-[acyl-carrier-protein] synthase-1